MENNGQTHSEDAALQNKLAETGIKKAYNYHKPSEDGLSKIKQIRRAGTMLDNMIQELAPHSRERSIAITELETAIMWAIKAVVINDPQSEIDDR